MNGPETTPSGRRRRVLVGAAAALAVAALVAAGLLIAGGRDAGRDPAAAGTPIAPVSLAPVPATPEPTGPTSGVDDLPPSLPPVALDEAADVGNGVTAEITSLEAIEGTGRGPGNVAGPALRATARITNGTHQPLSLDGVAVAMTHGADTLPASPLDDPSAAPFQGTVGAGDSAEGVYVFSVPPDDRKVITVTVGYQAGAPFLVFTGSAG